MSLAATPNPAPRLHTVAHWIARLASIPSIGMLAVFATSGGDWPTPIEWGMIAFFPIGVALGMVIGWKRALLGGVISIASLAAFYALMLVRDGAVPTTPWFFIFTSPGFLFLIVGLLGRRAAAAPE